MTKTDFPIGVFDSGIGGLSILKALRLHMPQERFVYFADTAHNPYGEKSEAFVQERTLAVAAQLVAQHQIKALVVACNTATAAAIHLLRAKYPALPIVGVEPALKPAALATRTGRVAVLATRGTLQSAKFAQLKEKVSAQWQAAHTNAGRKIEFVCTPCDGLAERIEHLSANGLPRQITPDLIAASARFIRVSGQFGFNNDEIDTLVLGCTHYPLIRDVFAHCVGAEVTVVDNALPVAQRTAQLLQDAGTLSSEALKGNVQQSRIVWESSAGALGLQQAARYWLEPTA